MKSYVKRCPWSHFVLIRKNYAFSALREALFIILVVFKLGSKDTKQVVSAIVQ